MKSPTIHLASAIAVATILSCGQSTHPSSNLDDISSPGSSTQANRSLWLDGDELVFAQCPAGTIPSRYNCTESPNRKQWVTIEQDTLSEIQKDLVANESARQAEISRLNNENPTTKDLLAKIAAAEMLIADLEIVRATAVDQITLEHDKKAKLQVLGSQLKDQITIIDKRLATEPTNQDLLALKASLVTDLDALQARSDAVNQLIAQLEQNIQSIVDVIQNQQNLKVTYQEEIERLQMSTSVNSPELERLARVLAELKEERDLLGTFLAKIADQDIVHRTSILPGVNERLFLRIFRANNARIGANGILEINHNGNWGGVCDDNFNNAAAQVACRMLNLPTASATYKSVTSQNSTFILDDIICQGSEASLFDCNHSPIGINNCRASEFIAISCP